MLLVYLLCVRYYFKYFLRTHKVGFYHYPHFADEETEAPDK